MHSLYSDADLEDYIEEYVPKHRVQTLQPNEFYSLLLAKDRKVDTSLHTNLVNVGLSTLKTLQYSYALKPSPHFCRTLSPIYQKGNFLPTEFTTL